MAGLATIHTIQFSDGSQREYSDDPDQQRRISLDESLSSSSWWSPEVDLIRGKLAAQDDDDDETGPSLSSIDHGWCLVSVGL